MVNQIWWASSGYVYGKHEATAAFANAVATTTAQMNSQGYELVQVTTALKEEWANPPNGVRYYISAVLVGKRVVG